MHHELHGCSAANTNQQPSVEVGKDGEKEELRRKLPSFHTFLTLPVSTASSLGAGRGAGEGGTTL